MNSFSTRLIAWQRLHGRHDLPWQGVDAYRVWLSEIMLQQTQVSTVIPYYLKFIQSFQDVTSLAAATEEQVLAHWSGLGYYARGRNLHQAAKIILEKYQGEFPRQFEQIVALPGVGRSTAAAICALAYQQRRAILDGNVKRLLARYCALEGWTGNKKVEEKLWQLAESLLPERDFATYTQALMDMGATVCTRSQPKCAQCPVSADCLALRNQRVHELPTARPRKTVPEKSSTFLLLLHNNQILLAKRPSSGLWGGLWCPPQLDEGEKVEDYAHRNGLNIEHQDELPRLTHIFTHFKLHITPLRLRLTHKPLRIEAPNHEWLPLNEALNSALPTPVRELLKLL